MTERADTVSAYRVDSACEDGLFYVFVMAGTQDGARKAFRRLFRGHQILSVTGPHQKDRRIVANA